MALPCGRAVEPSPVEPDPVEAPDPEDWSLLPWQRRDLKRLQSGRKRPRVIQAVIAIP